MTAHLVSYDLKKPGKDYSGFHAAIDRYSCIRLSPSCYAIATYETPAEVYERLRPLLDAEDSLWIMDVTTSWAGQGPSASSDWLHHNLTP
jgi:hypothetical protein